MTTRKVEYGEGTKKGAAAKGERGCAKCLCKRCAVSVECKGCLACVDEEPVTECDLFREQMGMQ